MILDRFKVTDKIAIVTGGTRGIGLAIAHALGEAGAKLVVTSRTDKFGGLDSLKKQTMMYLFLRVICMINQYPKK